MATSYEELTHWKRPWCCEELGTGGEGDNRGWDGWMPSPTRWAWVWVNSRSWWGTGGPGVLQFMGSQRVGHCWATELKWNELKLLLEKNSLILQQGSKLDSSDLNQIRNFIDWKLSVNFAFSLISKDRAAEITIEKLMWNHNCIFVGFWGQFLFLKTLKLLNKTLKFTTWFC